MQLTRLLWILRTAFAFSQKAAARAVIRDALTTLDFGSSERLVRISATANDDLWREDIAETVGGNPDGYVIPKVESPEHINVVADYLASLEDQNADFARDIVLIGIVETALGVVNLKDIAMNGRRLTGARVRRRGSYR